MTVEEALQIVDTICSQVQLNRQGHVQVQTAMAVILAKLQVAASAQAEDEPAPQEPAD